MSIKWTSIAAAAALLMGTILPAAAADDIFVPLFTYRTGPYSGGGIPIANGMHDYLNMLNARDGGIGGVKLNVQECETGYNTQKGIECYEAVKGKDPTVINPFSTGITEALIPKAAVDKIPILSMAYGLSAAALGDTFPWIFNPPDTYWDGLSVLVKQIAAREGGFDKLKGVVIGYIYLDAPYGKEPIPLLQQLAEKYGFMPKLYPVAGSRDAEPIDAMARRPPRPSQIHDHVGLGRDAADGRKRSRQDRLPNEQFLCQLVEWRRGFARTRHGR